MPSNGWKINHQTASASASAVASAVVAMVMPLVVFVVLDKTEKLALGPVVVRNRNDGIYKSGKGFVRTTCDRIRDRSSTLATCFAEAARIVAQSAHASSGTMGQLLKPGKAKARGGKLVPCYRGSGFVNEPRRI